MAIVSPERRHLRARKAGLSQVHPPGHPEIIALDQQLAMLRLEADIRETLSSTTLSVDQRKRLADLLLAGE